jgi:hypothetical protein
MPCISFLALRGARLCASGIRIIAFSPMSGTGSTSNRCGHSVYSRVGTDRMPAMGVSLPVPRVRVRRAPIWVCG